MTNKEAIKNIFENTDEVLYTINDDWDYFLAELHRMRVFKQKCIVSLKKLKEPERSFLKGYIEHILGAELKWSELQREHNKYANMYRTARSVFLGEHNISVDIELAKSRDILEVAGNYGQIKRTMMCCPIHKEKTPSLKLYPKTNSWHCFGCGRGGDVIKFIQETEQCSFIEAVKMLI